MEPDTERRAAPSTSDWNVRRLADLMAHIVEKHHTYCRAEVARLEGLMKQVAGEDSGRHLELRQIQRLFTQHNRELLMHLVKEEQTLFPLIAKMEEASARGTILPRPPYGTIEHPVRIMISEHQQSGHELEEIRRLSRDYTLPADAGEKYRALLEGLHEFEEDMREHVRLEDEFLFPRAKALEDKVYAD